MCNVREVFSVHSAVVTLSRFKLFWTNAELLHHCELCHDDKLGKCDTIKLYLSLFIFEIVCFLFFVDFFPGSKTSHFKSI